MTLAVTSTKQIILQLQYKAIAIVMMQFVGLVSNKRARQVMVRVYQITSTQKQNLPYKEVAHIGHARKSSRSTLTAKYDVY